MLCFVVEVWQTFVVGERVVFAVSCQTHSFASSQHNSLPRSCKPDLQLVKLQDVGMTVGGANDLALGCRRLRRLVALIALTVR